MATGFYDANGIWNYGEDDNIALFSDTLNKLADSTSDAFTSDRSRISTLEAGSLSGLIPIKPTSVTFVTGSGAVNDLGVVSFTGCTSLNIDGVFNSLYKNYRFILNVTASSVSNSWVNIRGRASGTELTGTVWYYSTYRWAIGSVSTTWSRANASEDYLLVIGASGGNSSGDIYSPNEALRTYITATSQSTYDAEHSVHGSTYSDLQQWTGIRLFPSGGNFTGTIQIFGYND